MECLNCGKKIDSDRKYCSVKCLNEKKKREKIERGIRRGKKLLECNLEEFLKSLINGKTHRVEPNKMRVQYFNNNYILPRYFEILEKTEDYKTLSFKERIYLLLNKDYEKEKTIDDLLKVIIKSNGGVDFNKLSDRWMERNGFLKVSKMIAKIEKQNLEEYLFLLKNTKSKCLTCGGETNFISYSKGYYNYCSVSCISNNKNIKLKKKKYRQDKMIKKLFNIENISPLFKIEDYVGSYEKYFFKCNRCNLEFESRVSNGHIPVCPSCDYKYFNGNSEMENNLIKNVCELCELKKSDRNVLNGKELDIYIPDKKLAIEFNGIYWHSELKGKDKNYHLDKTKKCESQNIDLIHIFENEWVEKENIIMNIIKTKLHTGFKKEINANDCDVRIIKNEETKRFLKRNHIFGDDESDILIGLFYDDLIVSVLTISKNKTGFKIDRFCDKLNYYIDGSLIKLWDYFKNKYIPLNVCIEINRRYNDCGLYLDLGFKKIKTNKPTYYYFKDKPPLFDKSHFTQKKLKYKFDHYDPDLTEWENMKLNGYNRIWDCGNYILEWIDK